MPEGWDVVAPNPVLAPKFELGKIGKEFLLSATGNGRRECFGYARHEIHLEANKTYRMRVKLRFENMDDLNRHLVHGVFAPNFNDGVFSYRRQNDWVIGDSKFPTDDKTVDGEVRLYFRFSPNGKVWWDQVSIQECEPIPKRLPEQYARHILGSQGQIWTEYIPTPQHAEYMALPRMCALSEVLWTPREKKDYDCFYNRLQTHLKRLEVLNVNFRRLDSQNSKGAPQEGTP